VRQFFAMFSVADFYLGPNSSGAHLAAAFDIPAVIVLNSKQYRSLPTFPDRIEGNRWRHESFLYPFHSFLLD
jgi:ADP-heptose:LPS heptosyltransferase